MGWGKFTECRPDQCLAPKFTAAVENVQINIGFFERWGDIFVIRLTFP